MWVQKSQYSQMAIYPRITNECIFSRSRDIQVLLAVSVGDVSRWFWQSSYESKLLPRAEIMLQDSEGLGISWILECQTPNQIAPDLVENNAGFFAPVITFTKSCGAHSFGLLALG